MIPSKDDEWCNKRLLSLWKLIGCVRKCHVLIRRFVGIGSNKSTRVSSTLTRNLNSTKTIMNGISVCYLFSNTRNQQLYMRKHKRTIKLQVFISSWNNGKLSVGVVVVLVLQLNVEQRGQIVGECCFVEKILPKKDKLSFNVVEYLVANLNLCELLPTFTMKSVKLFEKSLLQKVLKKPFKPSSL